MEKLYLKPNVLIEPLVNRWYAWSYLLPPPAASMYLVNSHLKILRSFISAPQVHISALKNPKMRGGPFINYDASRVNDIKALTGKTVEEQSDLIAMAEAIKSLDETLARESDGTSLELLYQKIPDALKGYVELTYDLNHKPSVRFIEGLLYRSRYYKPSSQSIALSLIEEDDRFFAFSTPRLEEKNRLNLDIPFNHDGLDELTRMSYSPRPLPAIKEMLGLGKSSELLFDSFFTNRPVSSSDTYKDDAVRIRYFGHACVLVECNGSSLLTDPLISCDIGKGKDRYTYDDLPERINVAVITHHHQDHCVLETLLRLRSRIDTLVVPRSNGSGLVDPSLKRALENIGFQNVVEIDEFETIRFGSQSVTGLPFLGEHGDLSIRTKMAYLVNAGKRSIMFAADSNNLDPKLYDHIHELTGDLDIIFLGMECDGAPMSWVYGPLFSGPVARSLDQSRRLDGSDCKKALSIIDRLKPKQVYVYAMGHEPWLTFITSIRYTSESRPIVESEKLLQLCKSRGIESERLFGKKEIFLSAF